ncbi:MAG: rhomboid family intramembrane serine protease [Bryobacterales bacterium]|nr:rhomboid family intramembrane serine protease [Bryobacterales bacterium]
MAYRSRSMISSLGGGPVPPAVKLLLISNTAVFLVSFFADMLGAGGIFALLGLSPRMVLNNGTIWQFATYMFIHSPNGIGHILFNMLALWMFGSDLERDWGTRFFMKYYLVCGIGAGMMDLVIRLLFSLRMDVLIIGASGAIFGLLLAYGMLYPNRTILFMLLFPIQAKYFVMIIGGIAFLMSFQSGDGVSHVTHLSGMLFGFLYLTARRRRFHLVAYLTSEYQAYKLRKAKKKFQVYMRKRDRDEDRWVN